MHAMIWALFSTSHGNGRSNTVTAPCGTLSGVMLTLLVSSSDLKLEPP